MGNGTSPHTVQGDQTTTNAHPKENGKLQHIVDFFVSSSKVSKAEGKAEDLNPALLNQNWKPSNNRVSPELPV